MNPFRLGVDSHAAKRVISPTNCSLFYRFEGSEGRPIWLISYATYGRITHIYIPSEELVIYDYDDQTAGLWPKILRTYLAETLSRSGHDAPSQIVVVVDLVPNYGHHLMNHLSGLERLLQEVDRHLIREVWISGTEFFPPVEKLFPELSPKIRRFDSCWDMNDELRSGMFLPIKVGTNVFRNSVGDRIRRANRSGRAPASLRNGRKGPLVAVTVRAGGRVCRNLPDVIGAVFEELCSKYTNIRVVLDGWVVPDGTGWLSKFRYHRDRIVTHMEMAQKVRARLPPGVVVGNTIGYRMSESLSALSTINTYISHVGTLQHKLAFFTGVRGVVHGPKRQLSWPDTGHFQADIGHAPLFLAPESVSDIAGTGNGNEGFNDYEIVDVHDLVAKCEQALAATRA